MHPVKLSSSNRLSASSCSAFVVLFLLCQQVLHSEAANPEYTVSPLSVVVERIPPASVVEKGAGKFFVDFGQVSFGALELEVANPEQGQQITVLMGEALAAPQTVNRRPGGSVRFLASSVTLETGKQVYRVALTPADQRLMPASTGPVMPFRYVEIEGAPPGFGKDNIRQLAVHYPFDGNAAHFDSADPKLNAIWHLCAHTTKATSFGGIFIDGDRERKPYEADAYINGLGWYCCTTDPTLPRYTWQHLVEHPT